MASSEAILVYLGANAHDPLEEQLLDVYPEIRFVESAIYPERRPSASSARADRPSIRFDSDMKISAAAIGPAAMHGCHQLRIIEKVINDKHLPLLWTRFGSRMRWRNRSEVKRYETAYSLIRCALHVLSREKPRLVVFAYEPHMLPMYVFKKVCEALGVATCTLVISPFSWRLFADATGGAAAWLLARTPCREDERHPSVCKLIEEKTSDYAIAKPFYEKRLDSRGAARRLLYVLRANGWAPHRLLHLWLAASSYRELATPRGMLPSRYICFFMQLQPEQTTLPDGGLFLHHLLAIQLLHDAVAPLGMSVVVREHPATFEYAFDANWRPPGFYDSLRRIGPGVYFDDLREEPYSLIRKAAAVCCISGTALLEGLLQGRPAIALGKHPLKGYASPSFVDRFDDEDDLQTKIAAALLERPEAIVRDVERYLHGAYPSSFGPVEYEGNAVMSLDKLRESRNLALRELIQTVKQRSTRNSAAAISETGPPKALTGDRGAQTVSGGTWKVI